MLYKLYVGCVAGRLTEWLMSNKVLSPCQKGFLPADGAFEHVHTLNRVLEKAWTHAADKCVAWLNVSNAFGGIPHPALEAAIERSGAGEDFLLAVRDIYTGATSSVSVAGGLTNDIPVRSGIKQGCPLSGLLFIMAIDLQGESVDHRVLAFADDLCLIADSPGELQASIDAAHSGLDMLGLWLNAAKCASLHLSGGRPVGVRDTQFLLRGSPLRPLAEGEAATFLGAQVGFNVIPPLSTLAKTIAIGLRIARSKLAPWQRIDELKTFFYTSTFKHRRAVMRTVRDTLRLKRSDALIAKPDQGRAVECVAVHSASSHFLRDGDFTRFADWRFVHRARLNLVPLNGSSSWRAGDRRCRRCGQCWANRNLIND
ncbi:unnamed protein product [Macrosiphum euphorbiae]|uniref:Reverse transcriptase domain-containing protein n=1 Tax=Macrosiphum euphorbiae TaxID=13131 RepID=A0AAV0WKP8_9HEMI|nr:unnamed protein product [Macrosiphum euphorbiae]